MSIHKVIKTVLEEGKAVRSSENKYLKEAKLSRSEIVKIISPLEEKLYDAIDSHDLSSFDEEVVKMVYSVVEGGLVDLMKELESKLKKLK